MRLAISSLIPWLSRAGASFRFFQGLFRLFACRDVLDLG